MKTEDSLPKGKMSVVIPAYNRKVMLKKAIRKELADKSCIMNMNPPGLDHWL